MLKRLFLTLALARAPLATAQADTLTAGQTKTTALADWCANIYYTEGTYQVVITLAPGPQEGGRLCESYTDWPTAKAKRFRLAVLARTRAWRP
jgi:hypothetical protein